MASSSNLARGGARIAMNCRIDNYEQIKRSVADLPRNMQDKYMKDGMRAALNVFARYARKRAPKRRGDLRRSVATTQRVQTGGRIAARGSVFGKVFIQVKRRGAYYGNIVESGSAAHNLRPSIRKAMHIGPIVSNQGFVRGIVRHPGFKANPFMENARVAGQGEASRAFEARVQSRLNALLA